MIIFQDSEKMVITIGSQDSLQKDYKSDLYQLIRDGVIFGGRGISK